jgi:adenylosuccinate synthase
MGITKAYCTRVGNGPFPSEEDNETGETLRKAGHEFGATTGRPRRCGWLDLVALRYAVELNGMNELALTKLDVLDGFETIKVCTAYKLDGKEIDFVPLRADDLYRVEPVYQEFPGWKGQTTRNVTEWEDLPVAAQNYVNWIEEQLGIWFTFISTGPKRNETIRRFSK